MSKERIENRRSKTLRRIGGILTLAMILAAPVAAEPMYAFDYWVGRGRIIDPDASPPILSGTFYLKVPRGFAYLETITSVARHPGTGVIYAIVDLNPDHTASASTGSRDSVKYLGQPDHLVTLNEKNWKMSVVAPFGPGNAISMVIVPSGIAYVVVAPEDPGVPHELATVDLATGIATELGVELGGTTIYDFGVHTGGLTVAPGGKLYYAAADANQNLVLQSIDPETLAVQDIVLPGSFLVTGLHYIGGGKRPSDPELLAFANSAMWRIDLDTLAFSWDGNVSRQQYYGDANLNVGSVIPLGDRPCAPSSTTLCLNQDRFSTQVTWRDFDGNTGSGSAVQTTSDSGEFWFFSSGNIELVVKVLNGCTINSHYWVFAAATTNVEWTLTVTDTEAEMTEQWKNQLGEASAAITEVSAFATCP